MAFVSSASRGNNPVKGRARSLFIPDRNYGLATYLADADGGSKRILPSRQTAGAEFQNMQENSLPGERPDRHPAAGIWERTSPRFHRDRSRRDLAQLCGPDRKIIRLRDKRGIYLFLIEITAITKYLAAPTADPGEFCGVGQTAGAEFPKYAGI